MTTRVIALGGSLLRPEEKEARAMAAQALQMRTEALRQQNQQRQQQVQQRSQLSPWQRGYRSV